MKKKPVKIPKLPKHIALFMDGNGRWANRRGMPRSAGHRAGAKAIQKLVEDCDDAGLEYLTAYAFSTENWKRSDDEVDNLMNLIREFLNKTEEEFKESDVRIRFIGFRHRLDDDIVKKMEATEEKTKNNKGLNFIIALDYGSRAEITQAVKQIAIDSKEGKIDPEKIDEDTLGKYLFTADIPDPDLLIRSSGEKRMSNYLLWQSSYSELWFSDVLWPDFKFRHLLLAVKDYNKRNRRFGGVNK